MEAEGDLNHRASDPLLSSQPRRNKDKNTNMFLTDSVKEVVVEFVKGHEELYDKTHKLFKNKA